MKVLSACFLAIGLTLGNPAFSEDLPTVQLTIKGHRLVAEMATTTATRTVGLMHRFSLKPDHGMLFVFNAPQPLAFWMKNTFVPLSIAFIDVDGRILNIEDMTPQTETTHPSQGLSLYALEMKKGWFAQRGIVAGEHVEGLDRAPRARE
jgi:uncharacterized membrane protein (UPF0127 family)